MKSRLLPQALAILLAGQCAAASAQTVALDWRLEQRFRLFADAGTERAFQRSLGTLKARMREQAFADLRNDAPRAPIRTRWDEAAGVHRADELLFAPARRIEVRVRAPARGTCMVAVGSAAPAAVPCNRWQALEAEVPLNAQLQAVWRGAAGPALAPATAVVAPKRLVVLGLGDSYGSGEGSPEIVRRPPDPDYCWNATEGANCRPAAWLDHRCHRSLLSGQALAAWAIAQRQDAMTETVFLGYACSGAEIGAGGDPEGGGLLGRYVGRETTDQVLARFLNQDGTVRADLPAPAYTSADHLAPQVEQALRDLCRGTLRRDGAGSVRCDGDRVQPDLLLVSIGGNDAGFGRVLRAAILADCATLEACRSNYLSIVRSSLEAPSVRTREDTKAALRQRYALVEDALAPLGATLSVISQYPDALTHMKAGRIAWCGDQSPRRVGPIALTDLKPVEAQAIAEVLWFPLNGAIREHFSSTRARERGWRVARMDYDGQRGRGLCTKGWFMSYSDAKRKQGFLSVLETQRQRSLGGGYTSGVAHPNFYGYDAQKRALLEAIGPDLPVAAQVPSPAP